MKEKIISIRLDQEDLDKLEKLNEYFLNMFKLKNTPIKFDRTTLIRVCINELYETIINNN